MYWVLSSAGVGKSALAQTIAEEARGRGQLGATFFFSRPNHHDNPMTVASTLAYQFAVHFPHYRKLIVERLGLDPTILEKDLDSQFYLLITQPFDVLQTKNLVNHPLLVVIDGLDECRDTRAQSTFIRLISSCAKSHENGPLCWLVCSRPEWHLKHLLPQKDPDIQCICDELLVDGKEGKDDVYRFLCDKFAEIRRYFSDEVDDNWPSEDEIVELSDASSGHFGFASTAMAFVGSDHPGDPVFQLQVVQDVVRTARISGDINPLESLDLLYHRIFDAIPSETLPITLSILSLHELLHEDIPSRGFSSVDVPSTHYLVFDNANILLLKKAGFYSALQGLHSVLEIPSAGEAHKRPLRVHHSSLLEFLRDPHRCGSLYPVMLEADAVVACRLLHWRDVYGNSNCHLDGQSLQLYLFNCS
jgi:hypothetical protein